MWHQDGAFGVPGQPREMSALQLWLHSPVLSWTNSCGQRGFSEGRATRTPKRPARLGGILTATWCWQLPGAPSCSCSFPSCHPQPMSRNPRRGASSHLP